MKKLLIILLTTFCLTTWGQDVYYVSPADSGGNNANAGTIVAPWATFQKAVDEAYAGDTIYFRGGVYHFTIGVSINADAFPTPTGRSGTKQAPIHYFNYPGELPIFDFFHAVDDYGYLNGFNIIRREHLQFRGFTVRNVLQHNENIKVRGWANGLVANIVMDRITIHNIGGTALIHNSGAWSDFYGVDPGPFAYDTSYFINMDTYDLMDTIVPEPYPYPGNHANGYSIGIHDIGYAEIRGCRTWNFSGDGIEIGTGGFILVDNCWTSATEKYKLEWATGYEGNGFKIEGVNAAYWPLPPDRNLVVVSNCIMVNNPSVGVANNLNADQQNRARFINNTAIGNSAGFYDRPNLGLAGFNPPDRLTEYYNNISFSNTNTTYHEVIIANPSVYPHSHNTWRATAGSDWPGSETNPDHPVDSSDFVSLDQSQLWGPRKSDGSLPDITFGRLAAESGLIGAGTFVGMSSTPDIGIDWAYLDAGSPIDSTATNILSFIIAGQVGISLINLTNHTVAVTMPHGTNVTSLSATGSVSTGGTVDPIFATARNYTTPQTFTVTAADGTTTQVWTVTVTVASAPPTSGAGLRQGKQLNLGRAIRFGTKYLIINP